MNFGCLPVVGSANYQGASLVELDIINGRNFVGLKISVAKHGFDPFKLI